MPPPTHLTDEFRQLLNDLMAEQDMSARRLGNIAEVGDTTILRILKRKMVPTTDTVDRLLAGLGYRVTFEITQR